MECGGICAYVYTIAVNDGICSGWGGGTAEDVCNILGIDSPGGGHCIGLDHERSL